ncbi:hypothetical protein B0H15DRAFT_347616 [Mycena belliarum]|uniref:Uncharacterized protein n=1 Tax=Mycena belliarum TaxID=1033014 RepID=A0AAD6U3J2_9AGAR|nr:hypothetical protein B0H15DRAFT_347616 [Mycena belliae]
MTSDTYALSLPTELLYIIFRLTVSTVIPPSDAPPCQWPPFSDTLAPSREQINAALRAKQAIAQVCRAWRPVAAALLYEELIVTADNARILMELLEPSPQEEATASGLGQHVRYIKTHPSFGGSQSAACGITDFLRLCPNTESISICKADAFPETRLPAAPTTVAGEIVRPIDDTTRASIADALTSLKAIFWAKGPDDVQARLAQVHFLLHILELSPNVEFLSIPSSLDSMQQILSGLKATRHALQGIKYLELQSAGTFWVVPGPLWQEFLDLFPRLQEVSHYTLRPTIQKTVENHSVTSFRLGPYVPLEDYDIATQEALLGAEVSALAGPGFSSLQRVVLSGDWSTFIHLPVLQTFEQDLVACGRQLIFTEGRS